MGGGSVALTPAVRTTPNEGLSIAWLADHNRQRLPRDSRYQYLLRSNQWLEPCYGAVQFAARCQRRSGVQVQRREGGHPGPAFVRHHREPQLGEVVEIKSDIFPLEGRPARAERVLLH